MDQPLLKIRMLRTFAGPGGSGQAGDLFHAPADRARELIEAGHAEEVPDAPDVVTTPFHGGLRVEVSRPHPAAEVPPLPGSTQAVENAQVGAPPVERRSADEVAEDARVEAHGVVESTGPVASKGGAELAAEETAAKVDAAQADAAQADPHPDAPHPDVPA